MIRKSTIAIALIAVSLISMKLYTPELLVGEERVTEAEYKKYVKVKLTTDFSKLQDWEKEMLPYLVKAAQEMDKIFWKQAYAGNKDSLLRTAKTDKERKYLIYNYGPWDRLNGNLPFKDKYGPKPLGANFYPADMTEEEFKNAPLEDKQSLYTLLRRGKDGKLKTIPYSVAYKTELVAAAENLRAAADISEDSQLKDYLNLRASALEDDDFKQSDILWLDMRNNTLDIIIGPIETYEDHLFGYKAANEAYVLVKDKLWSERLKEIVQVLPALQKSLPVDDQYRQENPGSNSQLAVFDVIYYAGDCNAGSKTIAVNLPNDEDIQLQVGTRRSQLKNVMQAKFDKILVPISKMLIADDQQQHIKFQSFFNNTMFHEVAHGLGIKNTITDLGSVRHALKEHASALEEGKADILGLHMITRLQGDPRYVGENSDIMDAYVTFMASIFRSVRFGAASAHGKANMIRFNYFKEMGAFSRDENTGKYRINKEKMNEAVNSLSGLILTIQGDGDYERATELVKEKGVILPELQADLKKLESAGIPVDIVFEQGPSAWGELD